MRMVTPSKVPLPTFPGCRTAGGGLSVLSVSERTTTRQTRTESSYWGAYPAVKLYYLTVQHSFNVKVEGRENFSTHRFDYAPAGLELYPEDPGIIETVEVVLQKGQNVRGFACYQDGEPADDISIVPEPEWWCANRWIPSFEVEPNGFFTLEHVVPGIYSIQARIPEGDGWTWEANSHDVTSTDRVGSFIR